MTRRHDALIPLTHDHHHALRNARILREAADGPAPERTHAAREFLHFFRTESIHHFREEEEVVFPLVALRDDAPTEGIERVLREHVRMHALVRVLDEQISSGQASAEVMRSIAEALKAHIRFEEDELFPAIERVAGGDLATLDLAERIREA